ncbi:MAG TPA: hypothetical protein DCY07_03035 [Rhodospirillaceae bacterium]|nr:hypothetical protein [Rhodospirillaceae bacterium]
MINFNSFNFSCIQPTVRPLTARDSFAYRTLRKEIIDIGEGKYFNTSYTRENGLTEKQWMDWCTETRDHCIFGTFLGDDLIGVMMVTRFGSPEDLTAEWEATWLNPNYRECGIAKLSYHKVQAWTKKHGYNYAKVFIREDNSRSRLIREKQGFVYIKTIPNEMWADGSIAAEHVFIKDLSRDNSFAQIPSISPFFLEDIREPLRSLA